MDREKSERNRRFARRVQIQRADLSRSESGVHCLRMMYVQLVFDKSLQKFRMRIWCKNGVKSLIIISSEVFFDFDLTAPWTS